MDKRKYKTIKVVTCIVLLLICVLKMSIICDTHLHLNMKVDCNKCLLISNIRELIKNVLILEGIILLFIGFNIIRKVIGNNKNNIYINLVWMKIRLNE